MRFRRDSNAEHRWTVWLNQHRKTLDDCGLPPIVLESELNWEMFLHEGYVLDGFGQWSGWTPSMLSAGQAQKLLEFLSSEAMRDKWITPSMLRELRETLE